MPIGTMLTGLAAALMAVAISAPLGTGPVGLLLLYAGAGALAMLAQLVLTLRDDIRH